jgi:hypothetical protein
LKELDLLKKERETHTDKQTEELECKEGDKNKNNKQIYILILKSSLAFYGVMTLQWPLGKYIIQQLLFQKDSTAHTKGLNYKTFVATASLVLHFKHRRFCEITSFCQILLVLSGIVRYHQVLPGIVKVQKSILMIRFLMVISQYFAVLISDRQHQVSDDIISECICLKFSQFQNFYAYYICGKC